MTHRSLPTATREPASGIVPVARKSNPTFALAALYRETTDAGGYGPAHAGHARTARIAEGRDIRSEALRIVPFLPTFSRFVVPPATTRGELVRALVPLAERLGAHTDDPTLGAPALATVRLLSAFADVLTSWDGERKVIEPRFVLVGDEATSHPNARRGHVVVLDPLGTAGEPGLGATLAWLSGLRVGRGPRRQTAP